MANDIGGNAFLYIIQGENCQEKSRQNKSDETQMQETEKEGRMQANRK